MAVGDFLATLTAEATIHHLDLIAGDRALAGPPGQGRAVAHETFDGILGPPVLAGSDDVDYALKASNPMPLPDDNRARLGALADRFPWPG
jgi:hypothetical protein